jgi:hypothetical protein
MPDDVSQTLNILLNFLFCIISVEPMPWIKPPTNIIPITQVTIIILIIIDLVRCN